MRILSLLCGISICIGTILFGAFFYLIHSPYIDFSVLTRKSTLQASIVLDDEGVEWTRFQLCHGEPIFLNQAPQILLHAFLATEDRKFYQHTGISWYGIVRSCLHNIYYLKFGQGASTITQQLVRLLFFDNKKTLSRKIKEQIMALIIEHKFSKDQIFETYLNHIYFGAGIYGVSAAAQKFWGKGVAELTPDECAVLAGIVQNPAKYCPLVNPLNTLKRRNVVLNCMLQAGYMSEETCKALQRQPIIISQEHDTADSLSAPHVRQLIRAFIEEKYGRDTIYTGGLIIKSTLNRTIQQQAMRCFKTTLDDLRSSIAPGADGGLITLESSTGAIKALVGGYSPLTSFNRAAHAQRQLGSTFKTALYAIALEEGLRLEDSMCDEPLTLTDHGTTWTPQNVTKIFEGPMTLARALITSNNMIAIKIALKIGTKTIAEKARQSGLTHVHEYPSLALGCIDATVLEAAAMFNVLANKGVYQEPYLISWVKDAQGAKIWQPHPLSRQVFSWKTTSMILQVLSEAVARWQRYLDLPKLSCAASGKTGTTNDARNCWFVGATPTYTTALYIGVDDNSPLGTGVYAIKRAFPLWHQLNASIPQPVASFQYEPSLVLQTFDPFSGIPTTENKHHTIRLLVPTSSGDL